MHSTDQLLAWPRVEARIENERLLAALEEAWLVGDEPDAAGRVALTERGIAWTTRRGGRLELIHDPVRNVLALEQPNHGPETLLLDVDEFSAALDAHGKVLRIGWTRSSTSEPAAVEGTVVLR